MSLKIATFISAILIAGLVVMILLPTLKQIVFERKQASPELGHSGPTTTVTPNLETQIETLNKLGLKLKPGISKNDVLDGWSIEDFENQPYSFLLYVMGTEVSKNGSWQFLSNSTWDFDTEYIHGNGSYVSLVNNLARLTDNPDLIIGVKDTFEFSKKTATVTYNVRGETRRAKVKVRSDWVDPNFIDKILKEITAASNDGRRFYGRDNGQAITLTFIDPQTKAKIDQLTPGTLNPL